MVDVADAPVKEGVMFAFLPAEAPWCQLDLPHMTLVYAGLISEHGPADFSAMAKDAASLATLTPPLSMTVAGVEVFGDTDPVKVLRFRPSPEILAARRLIETWNASKFPFNPHATVGPVSTITEYPPPSVLFTKLLLAWGNDQLVFNLKY